MILGINPTVDYAFKRLLGTEATRPILIDVLNAVLNPAPGHEVREVELLNPFNPKEVMDDKSSFLDIKARDQSGRQFNVEMQVLAYEAYEKRILYYWTKLYQQQLHEGEEYRELRPTISISFLNHVMFKGVPDHHLRFRLLEQAHHFPLTEDIEFHLLELPKFTRTEAQLSGGLDIWLYFLRHAEKMDTEALPAAVKGQTLVMRAVEELKMLTQSDLERERYEARRKAQLDQNTAVKFAREEGAAEADQRNAVRRIHFCERLLNRPLTPADQLAQRSLEDLTRTADELEAQVMQQR